MITKRELIRELKLAGLSGIDWLKYLYGKRQAETYTVNPSGVIVTVGKQTSYSFDFKRSEFGICCGDTEFQCCNETAYRVLSGFLNCQLNERQIYKLVSL